MKMKKKQEVISDELKNRGGKALSDKKLEAVSGGYNPGERTDTGEIFEVCEAIKRPGKCLRCGKDTQVWGTGLCTSCMKACGGVWHDDGEYWSGVQWGSTQKPNLYGM